MREMLMANDLVNVNNRLIPGAGVQRVRSPVTILFGLENFGLEKMMLLKVGDPAPDFALPAVVGERQITVRLRDYLDRQNLVVAFHPLDWTPT
jgi:hypothetical protein